MFGFRNSLKNHYSIKVMKLKQKKKRKGICDEFRRQDKINP